MDSLSFSCPICGTEANRAGFPFVSEWAVATHVAGCISVRESLHTSWASSHAPGVDLGQTVARLASALLLVLHQATGSGRAGAGDDQESPITVLHRFEIKLHLYVRRKLEQHFGNESEAWWVEGVPLPIRQVCAQTREADPKRDDLYQYIYLIDLKAIMDKNWALFEGDHARLRSAVPALQKKQFLELLTKVNEVRNRHSHPVRAPDADSDQHATDLRLARFLELIVDALSVQAP